MVSIREVAEDYLDRVAKGDIDRIVEIFTPDGEVRIDGSPRVPWLGRFHGHHAIRGFFEKLLSGVTVHRFHVEKIIHDDSDVVILGDLRDILHETGREFQFPFMIRLTILDDKVSRYHMMEDSYALHRAFDPAGLPSDDVAQGLHPRSSREHDE